MISQIIIKKYNIIERIKVQLRRSYERFWDYEKRKLEQVSQAKFVNRIIKQWVINI